MDREFLIWLPLALVVFGCFWAGIVCLTARISGWTRLSKQYRNDAPFTGKLWRWESAKMSGIVFRTCLTIGANRAGLYLAMQPMFRIGHPPLFIPWTHIVTTSKSSTLGFQNGLEMRIGTIPLWIDDHTAGKLWESSR